MFEFLGCKLPATMLPISRVRSREQQPSCCRMQVLRYSLWFCTVGRPMCRCNLSKQVCCAFCWFKFKTNKNTTKNQAVPNVLAEHVWEKLSIETNPMFLGHWFRSKHSGSNWEIWVWPMYESFKPGSLVALKPLPAQKKQNMNVLWCFVLAMSCRVLWFVATCDSHVSCWIPNLRHPHNGSQWGFELSNSWRILKSTVAGSAGNPRCETCPGPWSDAHCPCKNKALVPSSRMQDFYPVQVKLACAGVRSQPRSKATCQHQTPSETISSPAHIVCNQIEPQRRWMNSSGTFGGSLHRHLWVCQVFQVACSSHFSDSARPSPATAKLAACGHHWRTTVWWTTATWRRRESPKIQVFPDSRCPFLDLFGSFLLCVFCWNWTTTCSAKKTPSSAVTWCRCQDPTCGFATGARTRSVDHALERITQLERARAKFWFGLNADFACLFCQKKIVNVFGYVIPCRLQSAETGRQCRKPQLIHSLQSARQELLKQLILPI